MNISFDEHELTSAGETEPELSKFCSENGYEVALIEVECYEVGGP